MSGGEVGMSSEKKFAGLLRLCDDAKRSQIDVVVIHHPEVLGDTYEEIVESLNRIADAGLKLAIPPRTERRSSRN
jgi:hypothetical protein